MSLSRNRQKCCKLTVLCVYKLPHIVSCCGYSFCKTCIERVQAKRKPCPLCVESEFTVIHDKRLQRSLNELSVRCVFQKDGCGWTDKLGALDKHLNVNPDPETRLAGCGFTVLDCEHCGESIQRCLTKEHESEQCPRRPFSCDYCRDYESTFEDVANNHWPVCKCYPVPCPNGCTPYTVERQNLEHHITTECPLTKVECDFSYAGCKVTLPRKEMSDHIRENPLDHIRLLAVHNQKLAAKIVEKDEHIVKVITDLKETVDELKDKNQELEDQHAAIVRENKALKEEIAELRKNQEESSNASLSQKVDSLRKQVTDQETRTMTEVEERRKEMAALRSHLHVVPVELIMTGFKSHKQKDDRWYSSPFYTHLRGYKMCLCVFVHDDSNSDVEGTHVSVFAHLMRGEFDDHLKWPFRGDVTIQLLNQDGEERHPVSKTLHFTDKTLAECTARIPPQNPRAGTRATRVRRTDQGFRGIAIDQQTSERATGWGWSQFIPLSELTPKYLKDDCLQFQISEVVQAYN